MLAAGRGERLRPLTDVVAKPALDVGGKPLAAHSIEMLRAVGGRLAINVSWLADATRSALEPYAPAHTRWLIEAPEPFGTAGTIAALLPELAETFVVANGDVICDLDVTKLLEMHRSIGAAATLAVKAVAAGADLEIEDTRAVRFIDRRYERDASGHLYMGIAVLQRDAVSGLVELGQEAGLGETVLKPLVEEGRVAVLTHDGLWFDIGTPERLEEARRRFAQPLEATSAG